MAWTQVVILLAAGGAAGFVAGLVGIGGGIIFTPVLLVYLQQIGTPSALLPKLTIGSSLVCTFVAAMASARHQHRRGAVAVRTAWWVGGSSALAVVLVTRFLTTQPEYDATRFQIVFACLLLIVASRMALTTSASATNSRLADARNGPGSRRGLTLLGIGSAAGTVATAAGVGGGIVLVPAYHRILHLPMHRAVGTSSATIALISMAGIVSYAVLGRGADVPATAIGYVDARALLLALPALGTARLGVQAAHRLPTRPLRLLFATLAAVVALQMLYNSVFV